MGRPRDNGTAVLDPGNVDERVHAAQVRLLRYRAHDIAADPRKHPEAAAAVAAHKQAHAADFKQRAQHGPAPAVRQALADAAEQAVAALEAVFGPPPGCPPFIAEGAT